MIDESYFKLLITSVPDRLKDKLFVNNLIRFWSDKKFFLV